MVQPMIAYYLFPEHGSFNHGRLLTRLYMCQKVLCAVLNTYIQLINNKLQLDRSVQQKNIR